jgi:hypothetical protein
MSTRNKLEIFVAGFDRMLRTRSRLALSGGLIRPESKSFDRLRTLSKAEGPEGRIVHGASSGS